MRSLAEMASRHSADESYASPYTEEAIEVGMDLPWWQKIATTTLDLKGLEIGKLTVRAGRGGCSAELRV